MSLVRKSISEINMRQFVAPIPEMCVADKECNKMYSTSLLQAIGLYDYRYSGLSTIHVILLQCAARSYKPLVILLQSFSFCSCFDIVCIVVVRSLTVHVGDGKETYILPYS